MVKKWMKILKNILRFKNKHSPNILFYISFDAKFNAETEYICKYLLIAYIRWINSQEVNIENNILA
jgi:hypothetical protein